MPTGLPTSWKQAGVISPVYMARRDETGAVRVGRVPFRRARRVPAMRPAFKLDSFWHVGQARACHGKGGLRSWPHRVWRARLNRWAGCSRSLALLACLNKQAVSKVGGLGTVFAPLVLQGQYAAVVAVSERSSVASVVPAPSFATHRVPGSAVAQSACQFKRAHAPRCMSMMFPDLGVDSERLDLGS
eukprot:364684-Chlamydomonas_euryale.AAC.7